MVRIIVYLYVYTVKGCSTSRHGCAYLMVMVMSIGWGSQYNLDDDSSSSSTVVHKRLPR